MTDVAALKRKIEDSGVSVAFIAAKLGITREGLYKKLKGETEFKASEISKMAKILHLTTEQRDLIFFA